MAAVCRSCAAAPGQLPPACLPASRRAVLLAASASLPRTLNPPCRPGVLTDASAEKILARDYRGAPGFLLDKAGSFAAGGTTTRTVYSPAGKTGKELAAARRDDILRWERGRRGGAGRRGCGQPGVRGIFPPALRPPCSPPVRRFCQNGRSQVMPEGGVGYWATSSQLAYSSEWHR